MITDNTFQTVYNSIADFFTVSNDFQLGYRRLVCQPRGSKATGAQWFQQELLVPQALKRLESRGIKGRQVGNLILID